MSAREIDIPALIPHAGRMVLIDRVRSWNDDEITCLTRTHAAPDNPLRNEAGVPALAGAEYGAQAAAIHGGLLGRRADGYLVALRDLVLNVDKLDDIQGDMVVYARCRGADDRSKIYLFELRNDGDADMPLVSGRVTIAIMGEV